MAYTQLILGGARSGKSTHAEQRVVQLASARGLNKLYVATATRVDEEMNQRIHVHQEGRDPSWRLCEEPLDLGKTLLLAEASDCVLIDCLTLWVNNALYHEQWPAQRVALFQALQETSAAAVVMVSNEVGQGVVPSNALARRFIDESGWLHQDLGSICDTVSFVTAGFAQVLKGS